MTAEELAALLVGWLRNDEGSHLPLGDALEELGQPDVARMVRAVPGPLGPLLVAARLRDRRWPADRNAFFYLAGEYQLAAGRRIAKALATRGQVEEALKWARWDAEKAVG